MKETESLAHLKNPQADGQLLLLLLHHREGADLLSEEVASGSILAPRCVMYDGRVPELSQVQG